MEKGTDDYKELAPILNVHVNTVYTDSERTRFRLGKTEAAASTAQ